MRNNSPTEWLYALLIGSEVGITRGEGVRREGISLSGQCLSIMPAVSSRHSLTGLHFRRQLMSVLNTSHIIINNTLLTLIPGLWVLWHTTHLAHHVSYVWTVQKWLFLIFYSIPYSVLSRTLDTFSTPISVASVIPFTSFDGLSDSSVFWFV